MLFSLRSGVGLINVFIIGIVAAITLSITLTNTIDAISTNGLAHVISLIGTAEATIATTFDGTFRQLDSVAGTIAEQDWDYPSNEGTNGYAQWMLRALQLYLTGPSHFLLLYFTDASIIYVQQDVSNATGPVVMDYVQSSPVGALNLFTLPPQQPLGRNQTLSPGAMYFDSTTAQLTGAPTTPRIAFNFSAMTGPTWLYDVLLGNASIAPNAEVLLGVTVVRHTGAPLLALVTFANFRRPGDAGSEYPFGLTAAGITLDQLSVALKGVLDTPNSQALCVDHSGYIVASSMYDTVPFATGPTFVPLGAAVPVGCDVSSGMDTMLNHNDTAVFCRSTLAAYAYAPAAVLSTSWVTTTSTDAEAKQYTCHGDDYFAAALQLEFQYSAPPLHLLLIVPQNDIIGDVVEGRNVAIGVTCAAFAVAAALSFIATTLLLKPLGRIAERMTKAARLEDKAPQEDLSLMSEVRDLQTAYFAMNEELNRIRSFLPQAVLQAADGNISDSASVHSDTSSSKSARRSRRLGRAGSLKFDPPPSKGHRMDEDDDEVSSPVTPGDDAFVALTSNNTTNTNNKPSDGGDAAARTRDLQCALVQKVVSVVALNLTGFHREAFALPPKAVVAGLSDIVGIVTQEATSRGGVLAVFHGDNFMVTFNGARRCERHARLACTVAFAIVAEAHNKASATAGPLRSRCPLRAGVATGTCLVGLAGNAVVKTFATIGACVQQAAVLQRLVPHYGAGCSILATKRTVIDAGRRVEPVYVDVVLLPTRDGPTPVAIAAVVGLQSGDSTEIESRSLTDLDDDFALRLKRRNETIESHGDSTSRHGRPGATEEAPASPDTAFQTRYGDSPVPDDHHQQHNTATPLKEMLPEHPMATEVAAQRSMARPIQAKWDIISRIEPLLDAAGRVKRTPDTGRMIASDLGTFFKMAAS